MATKDTKAPAAPVDPDEDKGADLSDLKAAAAPIEAAPAASPAGPSMQDIMDEIKWLHAELAAEKEKNAELVRAAAAGPATVKPVGMPAMMRIVLEDNEDVPPTGLFIGLNGRSWMLRSGMAVRVPKGIIGVLDNAIAYAPVRNPATQQVVGYRSRKRFPYRVLREGEVAA